MQLVLGKQTNFPCRISYFQYKHLNIVYNQFISCQQLKSTHLEAHSLFLTKEQGFSNCLQQSLFSSCWVRYK